MAVIEIDGAQFGVRALEVGVGIVDDMPGMAGLLLVVRKLIEEGVGTQPILAGGQVVLSQLATGRPAVDEEVDDFANGFLNWMRLSGRRPDPAKAYLCSTTFDEHSLLVPTSTLVRLVECVSAMSNTSPDDARPVRPSPPHEVATWDRLRARSRVVAAAYARQVIVGRSTTLPIEALPDLAGLAHECDELEDDICNSEVPTPQIEARWEATRQRLLRELEAARIGQELEGEDLVLLAEFSILKDFHEAVRALRRYYESSARRGRGLPAAAASLLDARVSLDWFRWQPFGLEEATADEWLAECEAQLVRDPPSSSTGRRIVQLAGEERELRWRTEGGTAPCVWRLEQLSDDGR